MAGTGNLIVEDQAITPAPANVSNGDYGPTIIQESNDGSFYTKSQTFVISEPKQGRTYQQFQAEILQRYPASTVANHVFQLSDIQSDVGSSYNYTSRAYENFVSELDEKEIPNFYLSSDEILDRNEYQDHRGFNSNINETIFKGFGKDGKFRFNYKDQSTIDQSNNLLFGSDFDLIFFEEYKNVFPWVNRLEFTNPHNTDFFDLIRKVGVYEYLINDYISGKKMQAGFNVKPRSADGRPQVVSYEIFDMFEWSKELPFELQQEDKLLISRSPRIQSSYRQNFGKLVIAGRLRSLSYDKVRTIKEIHDGQLADYEICFYKVEKFIGNAAGQPVQSFWLPPSADIVKYYDSQVKVDTLYSYSIKGYFLVYGTQYSHTVTFPDASDQSSPRADSSTYTAEVSGPRQANMAGFISRYEATVKTLCSPSFKIVEVPLFTEETYVAQNPPMIPFVSFHNETNSTNNIEIFLNLAPGEKTAEFITVEPEDDDQIEKMNIINSGGTPVFSFTSEPGLFEVYRLSEPPMSYSDFSGYKLGEVRNQLDSSSILFREYLTSNKKYYYMFRAINSFGLKSNPTPIYEVELVRDADSSRVDVQSYEFAEPELSQPTLKFQQLMQITPAIQHVIVDETQDSMAGADSLGGKLGKISLGLSNDQLWGKSFKIRVSSATSGKKIDLNLTFNVKKNKTTEDFS